MAQSGKVRFEIVGSQQLEERLQRVASESAGELSILSSSKDKDPARLGLDFATIYHLVIAAGEAFAFGHLSLELCKYLMESNDPEIIIETPKGMIQIKKSGNLTKEEIADMIKRVLEKDSA